MQVTIIPAAVKGTLTAPASKSVMQRACAAALLRAGTTLIHNYGTSDDDKAALAIIQQLGAMVAYVDERTLKIHAAGKVQPKPGAFLDCGESGLSLRMFTPLVAVAAETVTISGTGSLLQRPVHFFEEILAPLGVKVALTSDKLPLQVQGPLQPASITIDGSLTSQFLTGLLLAYSVAAQSAVTIRVHNLKSKPYIDLTLKVMEDFKMLVPKQDQYNAFHFQPVSERKTQDGTLSFTVEGDWSNAAFLMVAGAIAGSVTVKGLDIFTTQADKKVLEALQDCGCRLSIQMDEITVAQHQLKAFHFDATECPDLFPPLVVLAACCAGTSVLEGVHRLTHKESNRALTLQQEFAKMGVDITLQEDKMIVSGGGKIAGATVHSHDDHRIAMACAVVALRAQGPVTIERAAAVAKSYPAFWDHIAALTRKELLPQDH